MKSLCVVALLALASVPARADRVDGNLQLMLEAARQLEFVAADERAVLLVKQGLGGNFTPVAVIFGYANNGTACEQLALVLSNSGQAGTFKCHPVY